MRRFAIRFAPLRPAGWCLLLLASASMRPSAAEELEDDPEARKEALLRIFKSIEEGSSSSSPSVLDGFDPRLASAAESRTFRLIRRTRVSIRLEKATAADALEVLRAASGLNFIVSSRAREALEAEKPSLTMTLDDLPLENAINLVALQLGKVRFTIRYGAVILMRADEWKPRKLLRVHDVSDLLRKPPDFPAPPLGLGDTKAPR